MENFDNVSLKGSLLIVLADELGAVKEQKEVKNLVVTAGKNLLASRLIGTADAVPSHMAVGVGADAAVVADTTLQSQSARVALDSATRTDNVVTFNAVFPPGSGTGALTEAGIFNNDTAGSMLCRTVFAAVNKGASDSLTIIWNLTIN
jgi:hypothetical protein